MTESSPHESNTTWQKLLDSYSLPGPGDKTMFDVGALCDDLACILRFIQATHDWSDEKTLQGFQLELSKSFQNTVAERLQ